MKLTKEERVEIVLLYGREGWGLRRVAAEFNRRHPDKLLPLSHSAVGKLVNKFKRTGSVMDAPKPGRPKIQEETKEAVLAKVVSSPTKSLRRHAMEVAMPLSTCWNIVKEHKFRPYKLQILHRLYYDDFPRRMEMCTWFLMNLADDSDMLRKILFTDEANFYVNGNLSKQHIRYWSNENPHFFEGCREQGGQRLMVWLGVWNTRIIGPFFFAGTVTAEVYLRMLGDELMPALDALVEKPDYFMQDGAPPHYANHVRHWLDQEFPDKWIGRGGPFEWAPRCPDLNPLDFCIWGYLKHKVYSVKIRDIGHLRTRIEEECRAIPVEMLEKIPDHLERRLTSCLNAGGMHFEHLM